MLINGCSNGKLKLETDVEGTGEKRSLLLFENEDATPALTQV